MHECEAKDVCVLLPNPGAIYAKGLWVRVIREIMKKGSQVEILRKKIFRAPNGSQTHDLPDTGWTL